MRRVTQRVAFAALILAVAVAGAAAAAGSITGSSIKDNSLTGKDIRNHSLTQQDFKGRLRGPAGLTGPAGPAGPAGSAGPPGDASRLTTVDGTLTVAPGGEDGGTVRCPGGTRIVSGGYVADGTDTEVFLSAPHPDGIGWVVAMRNHAATPADLTGVASCAGTGQAAAAARTSRVRPLPGRYAQLTSR